MSLTKTAEPHSERADDRQASEGGIGPFSFALLIALLVFVSFPNVVLGTQTFVFRDFGLFSAPTAHFLRECFWRGELPLWNALSHCGLPFAAQWNTLALYPGSIIYILLPISWGLPVFCLAHLVWGGLGMYLLARELTGHRLAAALAGLVFSFSGLALNFLAWPSHIATFSWLPWVWWLVPQAWRRGGRSLAWAAGAAALQILAGGPETIIATWLFLLVLAVGDGARRTYPMFRIARRLGAIMALAALVSAAQLLPFLQLLANSQRHAGYGESGWSMPLWGFASFLVPLFRTSPTPQGVFLQDGQGWTSSYYAGIGTILLAIVAFKRVKTWPVRAMVVITLICLLLALGDSGVFYRVLRECLPAFGFMRFPVKFVILVLALAPLLAAFGLRALTGRPVAETETGGPGTNRPTCSSRERDRSQGAPNLPGSFEWACTAVMAVLVGFIVMLDRSPGNEVQAMILKNGALRCAFLVLICILLAQLAKATRRQQSLLGYLLLVVFWLDFRTHVPNQNPTASPEIYTPGWAARQHSWTPAPALGHSRAMISAAAQVELQFHALPNLENTYLGHRLGLLANCNLLDETPQAHGFFSLVPGAIDRITSLPYEEFENDFTPLLDFIGVSQISSPDNALRWVPRQTAMPLVTAGQKPVFADDATVCAGFSNRTVNLRDVVFLPQEASGVITAGGTKGAKTEALECRNQRITFVVESAEATLAVIAQTHYPAWKAYVNDKQVKIWRANYAFQALEVPPGRHVVRIEYEDTMFRTGLVLSAAGLLTLACMALRRNSPNAESVAAG